MTFLLNRAPERSRGTPEEMTLNQRVVHIPSILNGF